jgi:hypothetical protein
MTGGRLDGDPFEAEGLDGRVLVNIGWTATEGEYAVQTETGEPEDWLAAADAGAPLGRLVTGSVIDFDQNVNRAAGEHVAPAQAGASA